jgi:hypothetical protein
MNRRRFTRSAMTPPYSVNSRIGSDPSAVTSPTANGEFVNCKTSHPSPITCIQVPQREMNWPVMNNRKFRCRSAAKTVARELEITRGR